MKKNVLIIFIVSLLLVCFFGGYFFAKISFKNANVSFEKEVMNKWYSKGWEDAKKRVLDNGLCGILSDDQPRKAVNGRVISVEGDTISVKITPFEPFASPELDNRDVVINDKTVIYKMIKKSEEEYQTELSAFMESNNDMLIEDENMILLPQKIKKVQAGINDIKKDVNIFVSTKQDIKNLKTFVAFEITIN